MQMKKHLKTWYNNFRFQLSANNHPLFIGFYNYLYRPKKDSIAAIIDKYSRQKKGDFTVIQVGANDGINNDPIHKFIKRDEWHGVLLEPQKEVFDTYLSKIYQKDKYIQTLNAAIGEEDGFTYLYKIGFSQARWATGLATFEKKVLEAAFTSGHVHYRAAEENIAVPENETERIVQEKVHLISPTTLLKKYHIQEIDLLQIDTEGFDYEIIKLFDIPSTKPKMIAFEHCHLSEETRLACKHDLERWGYRLKEESANTLAMWQPSNEFHLFFRH